MLPTGLGILAVSQKALDANKANGGMARCFFAWEDHIKTNDLGYFPYTPATQLLQGLRCSLDLIFAEGLENVFARHHRLANGVRAAVDAWGLKLCAKEPKWHSDTVSAILAPEGIDSAQIVKTAYYRYNTSLGVGLNKVAGRVFRIGHLGALDEFMIGGVLFAVEMTLKDCGVPVKFGSGTGAAAEYFNKTATKAAELPKAKAA
jgi:alanine-glyoxylate transaminase/serine-glyoxylate transaminase/serine-pyruvate transaminase